jgi:hypothetical protein
MSRIVPIHQKQLAGTDRPDRSISIPEIEDQPIEEIPPPPLWLPNAHAVNEWLRLAPILIKDKLLTAGSLSALGQMCALHGKIVQLYAAGESPGASMLGTLRTMHNDFGLTPMSQGKVRGGVPVEPTKPKNRFSGIGKPKE